MRVLVDSLYHAGHEYAYTWNGKDQGQYTYPLGLPRVNAIPDYPGFHPNRYSGIWQHVYLKAFSHLRVKDVYVKTSVENGQPSEISLQITVENNFNFPCTYRIPQMDIFDCSTGALAHNIGFMVERTIGRKTGGKPALDTFTIGPFPWTDAELWEPDAYFLQKEKNEGGAQLYVLATSLEMKRPLGTEFSKIDEHRQRFGFREVSTGRDDNGEPCLLLNDKRLNIRGHNLTAHFHYIMWNPRGFYENKIIDEYRPVNIGALRLRAPIEEALDVADEQGMLIVESLGIHNQPVQPAIPLDQR